MPPIKDLTGQRFGRLVALEPTDRRVDGKVVWSCICDCGKNKEVISKHLISNATQSCGCIVRDGTHRRQDLSGKVIGRLLVLYRKPRSLKWTCLCECGLLTDISTNCLNSKSIQSCGCLRNDRVAEACTTHGLSRTSGYFAAVAAKRRIQKYKQTPMWADKDSIRNFYINCPQGHHVDHIEPIKHKLVCGLHVIENLQYLPARENLKKNNSFASYVEVYKTKEKILVGNPVVTRSKVSL